MTKQQIRFLTISGLAFLGGGVSQAFPGIRYGVALICGLAIGILIMRWHHES